MKRCWSTCLACFSLVAMFCAAGLRLVQAHNARRHEPHDAPDRGDTTAPKVHLARHEYRIEWDETRGSGLPAGNPSE
ncbi:MAG: hypothetical protein BWY59_01059 [Verrucomicrobia bacterium ADurb.Bin345]|nr:MAG: hypothetical protein BWY59_01059 [Verrucomicrobia bacterium ADurb.Bin345]